MAAHEEGIYMGAAWGRVIMLKGVSCLKKKGRRSLAIWFFINHFIHIVL